MIKDTSTNDDISVSRITNVCAGNFKLIKIVAHFQIYLPYSNCYIPETVTVFNIGDGKMLWGIRLTHCKILYMETISQKLLHMTAVTLHVAVTV